LSRHLQRKDDTWRPRPNAFDVGDYVVYPKHGVGRVIELQKQEIAGMQLELYVLRFEKSA
jgi:CarD family transcriptional regulator